MGKRTKRQLSKVTKRQPKVHATSSKKGDVEDVEAESDVEIDDMQPATSTSEIQPDNSSFIESSQQKYDTFDGRKLISHELMESLGDSNIIDQDLILPSKKQKQINPQMKAPTPLTKEEEKVALKMNKKLKRKLDHLKIKKEKESARSELHESLAKHALPSEHLSLMVKSSNVGQELSLKQRLKDSMNRQKAGLEVSEENLEELHKQGHSVCSGVSIGAEGSNKMMSLNENGIFSATTSTNQSTDHTTTSSIDTYLIPAKGKDKNFDAVEIDQRRSIKLERQAMKRAEKRAKKIKLKEEASALENKAIEKDIGSIGSENRKMRNSQSKGRSVGWTPVIREPDSDDDDDESEKEVMVSDKEVPQMMNEAESEEDEEDDDDMEDEEDDDDVEEDEEDEVAKEAPAAPMSVAARMMASLNKLKQSPMQPTALTSAKKQAKSAQLRSRKASRVKNGKLHTDDNEDDDDDDSEEEEVEEAEEGEEEEEEEEEGGADDDVRKDKTNMVKWTEQLKKDQQPYIPQPIYEPFGGSLGGTVLHLTSSSSVSKPLPQAVDLDNIKPAVSLSDFISRGGTYQGDGAMGLKRTFVNRPLELQARRMLLPVNGMEQEIVESVVTGSEGCMKDVIVLCGETGSGKSTQVPQFLFEYGFGGPGVGLIGVTQPRRVAAVSTAQRVAHELQTDFGDKVGVQIRGDSSSLSDATRIKFMTDGILLQEIKNDFLLRKYSVIILDEAHERNLNTDVLIGLLSRALPLRNKLAREQAEKREQKLYKSKLLNQETVKKVKDEGEEEEQEQMQPKSKKSKRQQKKDKNKTKLDSNDENEHDDEHDEVAEVKGFEGGPLRPLKLIIMSATLRVDDFIQNKALFPKPPALLRVQSRQYPVTIHFNKKTASHHEYLDECFHKVCKIHTKLPPGAILVFLTGRREILAMCKRIRKRFKTSKPSAAIKDIKEEDINNKKSDNKDDDDAVRDMDMDEEEFDQDEDDQDDDKDDEEEEEEEKEEVNGGPVEVYPLFAMLSNQEQSSVFNNPKNPNARMIIVSTNVAETSVTIPGVTYVVDCGRSKQRVLDHRTGISSFEVDFISRSSADQRAGRAGRTGPGHCYRLYSSNVYATVFKPFHKPEVRTRALEDVVLQMKAMNIANVNSFPFPSPPDPIALRAAHLLLLHLGALANSGAGMKESESDITELGRNIATIPLNARYAKMILLGRQCQMLGHVIALVAALSENDPFVREQVNSTIEKTEEASTRSEISQMKYDEKQKRIALAEKSQKLSKHKTSDALARLKALGAYLHASGSNETLVLAKRRSFCAEYSLHEPTLMRMQQVEKQLRRVLKLRFPTDQFPTSLPPPKEEEELKLRQIILSAHLDHVGRLCPPGTVTSGSLLDRNCAYLASTNALSGEAMYLSPTSTLFDSSAAAGESFTEAQKKIPKWVVFDSVIRATGNEKNGGVGRAFMTCVTAIEPSWIPAHAKSANSSSSSPSTSWISKRQLKEIQEKNSRPHLLLKLSKPLESHPPVFDPLEDCVKCYVSPTFGVHSWQLKPVAMSMKEANCSEDDQVRHFARLLLEGKVIPEWSELITPLLNDPPALLTAQMKGLPSKKITLLLLSLKSITSNEFKRKRNLDDSPPTLPANAEMIVSRKQLKDLLLKSPKMFKDALSLWIKAHDKEKLLKTACGFV